MTEGVIGRRQKGRRQVWSSKIDVAEGGRGIHRTCKEDISHAEKKKRGGKKRGNQDAVLEESFFFILGLYLFYFSL